MNAKNELLEAVGDGKMRCVYLLYGYGWRGNQIEILLHQDYTKDEYDDFLKKIDFEYDDGYGGQMLHGNIWLEDGTWFERGEYDGSEWWEHKKCPEIPNILFI